jgi:hypothetical protein
MILPVIRMVPFGGVKGADNLVKPAAPLHAISQIPIKKANDTLFVLGKECHFLSARTNWLVEKLNSSAVRQLCL